MHILHLEDDALDADLVHREVARHEAGATWTTVDSADAFFDAMKQTRFDAILSDNRVPGIDGLQALQVAREQRPGMPFVFVSGNTDPHWAEHCLIAGATDYVPKTQLWRMPSALQRIRSTRESERLVWLTRARAVLVDAVKQLSLARSVDAIVEIVRHAARQINQADGATFVLRDGDHCHYVDEDAISPLWKGLKFPLDTCISGWAMLNRQHAVVPDIYLDPRIPHDAYRPTFVKSLVMVPIRGEAPIGAIGNYWATAHEATPDEVELIQALADSTSLAFENVALVQGLESRVQHRTAELEEANRELEAFSFSVSHDLRAPLRAMQGYSDLLAELTPPLEGEAATFVQHIRHSARRMNTLIDDMLALSKLKRAEVRKRPVSIGVMARDILASLSDTSPARKVRTAVDETLVAEADAALLRMALDNLLSNAWKYTSKRDDAFIEFFAEPQADGRLAYCVRDNGAGFDMAYAQRLFEPFRRMHTEADFPGTGVGLAIVQRVIRKHGGELWAQAAKNRGATFRFTLPADA
ncbi:ATP-binding protein [Piscinibacter sp. HJYY11]|uniref:ATP-binding protein n=1 Tax=Piscinibacter sp. HJYY11 TaxID=2801333 RepID=UPI00191D53F2|nr:ATP-binding protein [Piscinibacter sp. HJYY11]MBL0730273.1 response regulator [Piscinibacter sp. HJYY11]